MARHRARVSSSSFRASNPKAPCPTAGRNCSGSSNEPCRPAGGGTTCARNSAGSRGSTRKWPWGLKSKWSRTNPAAASSVASISVESRSFWSRVPTLPRKGTTSRSGRAAFTAAARRVLLVANTAPRGSSATVRPGGPKNGSRRPGDQSASAAVARTVSDRYSRTSRTSSRGGVAARHRPSGNSVGRSFRLWTARSASSDNKATSSSLVNKPRGRAESGFDKLAVGSRSPVVLMMRSSKVCSGKRALSAARTRLA